MSLPLDRRPVIVAVAGPNGAGKSTALKLLMGLSSPTGGTVRIFGADPRNTAARLRIGVMLQVGKAPEMLQVREHIEIFRGYYPNPMPYADIIRAAGLEGHHARNEPHHQAGRRRQGDGDGEAAHEAGLGVARPELRRRSFP